MWGSRYPETRLYRRGGCAGRGVRLVRTADGDHRAVSVPGRGGDVLPSFACRRLYKRVRVKRNLSSWFGFRATCRKTIPFRKRTKFCGQPLRIHTCDKLKAWRDEFGKAGRRAGKTSLRRRDGPSGPLSSGLWRLVKAALKTDAAQAKLGGYAEAYKKAKRKGKTK